MGCELPGVGSRTILLSAHRLQKRPGHGERVLLSLEDVTERREAERLLRRRLMRYLLDEGKVYLMKGRTHRQYVEAFKDLLTTGYDGTVISCTTEEAFRKDLDGRYDYVWLAEHGGERGIPPRLTALERRIGGLPRHSAVLIDRLDYILFKNGLEATLSFVQHLREMAYVSGHVIVLGVDPSDLDERALRRLEKETEQVDARELGGISEELLAIVRYVYRTGLDGERPSFSDVDRELAISKPTARKRIRELIRLGYLVEVEDGATKRLEATEKCWQLLAG
ncbi:MAG: DUF835 domain-containing protein [Methanopyri archaeon]|jgi:hypothetical protein|nr:DUF835 domain-containing protein [Methanopyri archaeon]